MTRRELLVLGKNAFISLFLGGLLGGCGLLEKEKRSTYQLASLLGYLLYGDNPPIKGVEEIEKQLKTIAQNSFKKRLELHWLYIRICLKKNSSFETLSSEKKRNNFRKIMPMLVYHHEITDLLRKHLEGDRVLEYLDYPDLPGEFGLCGWLVLEGEVWDRYYPPLGS